MTKGNQSNSGMFQKIKLGFASFTGNYMDAVKKGANIAEKEIIKTMESRNSQSFDIGLLKLYGAVKKGVVHAMKQMVAFMVEALEQMKDK
ncbi:hypothetical protein SAMN04487944_12124 [Gracilibacillus ureilyticus]|uniref:Uncharacterized protein n=1 Tax=Gracilibacillus ureilyticus TaxID=531814 RepID=A0A1H9V4L5_9BACI|nr:hypothetical protein [Gracilibacillus ureilyticus]SES16213.1 hypothetical protein SAMN04487944_12124 [Gracilibacillus ureilyticus]